MKFRNLLIAFLGFWIGANAHAQCNCQPPYVWANPTCIAPQNAMNACDDGTLGTGVASLVSQALPGPNTAVKFQAIVNKKLACCMNSFDPANPAQKKYDCVDNSTQAYASFDDLWSRADPIDSGGQSYAMVLTSGGNGTIPGKIISGFYTLAGGHCDEFSEFGGALRKAKVNPGVMAAQQDKASASTGSPQCAIEPGLSLPAPTPSALTIGIAAVKTLPYDGISTTDCVQAMNMRRCPILVRAAMIATCPRNPVLPGAQISYTDSASPPVTHCLAAATIRTFVHIEQLYEVSGMPNMQVVDTFVQQGASTLSISNIIQSKVGVACPGGTSQVNGSCMGCTAGCGGTGCAQCAASTFSTNGTVQCVPCPIGQYSVPGASLCLPCNAGLPGFYWIGNGTSPTSCTVARCTNGNTGGFGFLNQNCP